MAHKVKALQQWCKIRCEGYRDVAITNFTSSWKSGLAFCAIIHRYRPDLIDYDSLKKEDTYGNSKLAFDVALHELNIAALLDPEDMVAMAVPDKLCIVTYVAQYYNYFHNKEMKGGPGVKAAVKRSMHKTDVFPSPEPKNTLSEITNTPTAMVPSDNQVSPAAKRRTIEDRCCMCQGKVYLLERHLSGGKLYHRHCCREFERSSTLKLNKENYGSGGEKKDSGVGGKSSAADANKTPSIFGLTSSSATPTATHVTPTVPSSSSTGLMKSLFVPSKYPSPGTTAVSSEASKVPADIPKTVATAYSGTSTQLSSPFAPKTTTSSRTGVWGLTATTSASNPSSLSTSNYLTSAAKSSAPGTTTTVKTFTPVAATTVKSSTPVIATTVKPYTPVITTVKSSTPVIATTVKTSTPGITTAGTVKSSAPGLVTTGVTTTGTVKSSTPGMTVTLKSSTPETNTSTFSKWFGSKNSTQPSKDTATVNTPKTTSATTTVSSFLVSNPKSALSSGSKLTPGTVSPAAVTTSSGTSKNTSIFASRTTPTATPVSAGATTTVPSSGYISTLTTTVSGQIPPHQTGLKDISFTFKIDSSNNTPRTTASSASGSTNKTVASTFLVAKSPTGFSSGGKGVAEGVKSGSDTSPKAEWQLEAERRQKTRNGVYVDPEKYPQRNNGPGVTSPGVTSPVITSPIPVEAKGFGGKKEIDLKKDTEKTSAKQSLVTILQKQLNTKSDPNKTPRAVIEEVPPQARPEDSSSSKTPVVYPNDSWEIVERSEYDDTRPGISRSPPFRVPDTEISSVEAGPLSPPEMWKKVVIEGNIGFSNTDTTAELSRKHSFENSPQTISKRTHVVRNPSVPKRTVHAEKKIAVDEINRNLERLDQQLRVVEAEGRKLEDKIRGGTDDAMDEDEEEVMIQWFDLVKQKYDLVRDESDLMYRRRQQELEELHEELEYQFRCLNIKPDDEKTYSEREYEKQVLHDLFEVVKLRDNIVNSIEVDRQRYLEEDEKLMNMMEASGIHDSGKGKKKHKKNKKKIQKKFSEKGGTEKRKSWLGFRRSSSVKFPPAKDVE